MVRVSIFNSKSSGNEKLSSTMIHINGLARGSYGSPYQKRGRGRIREGPNRVECSTFDGPAPAQRKQNIKIDKNKAVSHSHPPQPTPLIASQTESEIERDRGPRSRHGRRGEWLSGRACKHERSPACIHFILTLLSTTPYPAGEVESRAEAGRASL